MACSDAAELQARLAFRALFPIRREEQEDQAKPSTPDIKVGTQVVAGEEFLSDSGQQDKVLLKQGQRGCVVKINDAGSASVDFEDHQKLQWVLHRNLHKLQVDEPAVPSLRSCILEDLNDAMESGLRRRLARLEKKFEALRQGGASRPSEELGEVTPAPASRSPAPAATTGTASAASLSKVLSKVLQTRRPVVEFGPSDRQRALLDPSDEKDEDIVDETHTLRLTLECLEQNINSRIRQVRSLQGQNATNQGMCGDVESKVESASQKEKKLRSDPLAIEALHAEELRNSRQEVETLQGTLEEAREKAKSYESLFKQQRRYLRQNELVSMMPGQSHLLKHPAGEIALVPQPPPLEGDDRPEVWDIGVQFANPYVVDSWPFEPNVLARRTFNQEVPMPPFKEETTREMQDEMMRIPNRVPNLHLPVGGYSDDDDDEEEEEEEGYAGGQTGTARSL